MENPIADINRPLVGIVAVTCIVVSLAMRLMSVEHEAVYAALMRVGLVMGALWVALPALGDSSFFEKLTPLIAVGMILLAVLQKRFLVLMPLLAVILVIGVVLRPRPKERPRTRPPGVRM